MNMSKIDSEGKYSGKPRGCGGETKPRTVVLKTLAPAAKASPTSKHSPSSQQIRINPHTDGPFALDPIA